VHLSAADVELVVLCSACAEILASLDAAAQQQAEDEMPLTKKGKKQQQQQPKQQDKKRKHSATAVADADAAGADDVGALKARLQKLEAENRALKKQRKPTAAAAAGEGGDGSTDEAAAAAGSEPSAAADAAKQQRKHAKKKQRLEKLRQKRDLLKQQRREQQQQEAAQRQQEQEQVPDIDMSAWERFDLHPELVKSLARRGFSAPTPIQDAVLEPAIRDRRDVIGAAQTGSGKTLAFGLPILQVGGCLVGFARGGGVEIAVHNLVVGGCWW
jgi:ATP-dependent RNA helicase DDX24/MAK5